MFPCFFVTLYNKSVKGFMSYDLTFKEKKIDFDFDGFPGFFL